MKKIIAVVDDEPDILELISIHFQKSNFIPKTFLNGKDFLDYISKEKPDLIILDLMLPDADGLEICKNLRSDDKFPNIPIIILTAKGDEIDKILGLELGADDYITKPFSPKELIARTKAVLRRGVRQESEDPKDFIHIEDILTIDLQKYKVFLKGEEIILTPTEFRILKLLSQRKGWVFSREKILEHLWGNDKNVLDRTIDVHIRHLREKLEEAGSFIKNIRGVGYKLEP